MSFLKLSGKKYLVVGVANKKSIATHIARIIVDGGGQAIFSVQNEANQKAVEKLFPQAESYICDVCKQEDIDALAKSVKENYSAIDGIVHSVAFANYSDGLKPFHDIEKQDFMYALDVSCFSLIAISNSFRDILAKDGSVVTISISTVRMASENYGYMAPIKAALDSSLVFLAKSFSEFSEVRFNAVAPGPLKTLSSAGIPGYVDSYLFAEKTTLRNKAVSTIEAANVGAFLLSEASSGITAQKIVVDGGMEVNYFNKNAINKTI